MMHSYRLITKIMWSPTLTTLLFIALIGQQLVSATGSANAADPYNQSGGICKPSRNCDPIGNRSACKFTMTEDYDPNRIPSMIYHFSCNSPDSLCPNCTNTCGDYRCFQIKIKLQVAYRTFNTFQGCYTKAAALQEDTGIQGFDEQTASPPVEVNASCVCATSVSGPGDQGDGRTAKYLMNFYATLPEKEDVTTMNFSTNSCPKDSVHEAVIEEGLGG
ncbi:hypothetical protein MTO96_012241 [Rhipicephalus appendiculatus]